MSKYLENKLSMYVGVKSFLGTITEKASTLPAFVKAIEDFNAVIAAIQAKSQEVDEASAGKTEKKADSEEELLGAVVPVKAALVAYASVANEVKLAAIASVTESQLRKMRDTDLQKKANAILQAGTENLTAAADYGLKQARLTALQDKLTAFSDATGEREASVGKRVAARAALMELYDTADKTLVERLDNLIEQFRDTDRQMCEQYDSTRVVREAGLRHNPVAAPEQQTAQTQPAS